MLLRFNTLFINQPKFLFYIYIFRCGSISLKDLLPHYKISHSLFSSVQKNDLLTKKWSAPVYVKNAFFTLCFHFSGDLYGTMLGKGRSRQWQVLYIYLSIFYSIYIYLYLKIPRGNKTQQLA